MAKTLQWFRDRAKRQVSEGKADRVLYQAMDQIHNCVYKLPEPLASFNWMLEMGTTIGADALNSGSAVLSNNKDILHIDPITVMKAVKGQDDNSITARGLANLWEKTLQWQMAQALLRNPSLRFETLLHAMKYAEACHEIIHIPTQVKAKEDMGLDATRYKAAMHYGHYIIAPRNPSGVYARYSDYMLEGVTHIQLTSKLGILSAWGKDFEGDEDDPYILVDVKDLQDGRCVFAMQGDSFDSDREVKVIMEPKDLDHPFLSWSCSAFTRETRRPLLDSVYRSRQLVVGNILASIEVSQALAESGKPKYMIEGPNPGSVLTDHGEPAGRIEAPPGYKLTELSPSQIDRQLSEVEQRLQANISSSSIPNILRSAEGIAGEAYSQFNLRLKSALGKLVPFKVVAEDVLAGDYKTMLLYSHYSGEDIEMVGDKQYKIDSEDIDPYQLYLDVTLTPDVPTDRQQQVNTVVMMADKLGLPATQLLRELGYENAEQLYEQFVQEQFTKTAVAADLQFMQMERSGQIQQMVEKRAQEMLQQQMQQSPQMQQQGPGQMQPMNPGAPQGLPGVEGQGFNTGMGGQPPNGANPSTREQQTGMTRAGTPA